MSVYKYMAPPDPGRFEPKVVYMTEQEIIYDYWDYWKHKMEDKYGKDHPDTTPDNCIKDWVIIHHASEVKG